MAQDDDYDYNNNQSCFSLKGSSTCPAYEDYYISLLEYSFLENVTDIASFDEAMIKHVKSSDFFLIPLGCENKVLKSETIPYARYSLTYLCANLIQDSYYSLPCNYDHKLSPPPLCRQTCFQYMSSVNEITNSVSLCPNQAEKREMILNMNSSCEYWSGLNATFNCVIGIANEPNLCGFGGLKEACQYCQSTSGSKDACCQLVSGCQKLSVGAIIGIIIGCLVFVGIVGAIIFRYFCYKKKRKNGVSYNGFMMNYKKKKNKKEREAHDGEEDSSSAFAYESLVSQHALVSQPYNHKSASTNSLSTAAAAAAAAVTPPTTPPSLLNIPQQQQQQQQQQQTSQGAITQPTVEEFFEVKHPYPPQMGDELALHVGDIVCVAMNFDDGWALGFNVTTGLKGVFPLVCVTPVPEELLEQLLLPEQPATNKTLVEDGSEHLMNMEQIRDNIRRSISISSRKTTTTGKHTLPTTELTDHSNIPRRTASIMRDSYDYHESDSPTSPTQHTPFFDVSLLYQNTNTSSSMKPKPSLFQPTTPTTETYEIYRKLPLPFHEKKKIGIKQFPYSYNRKVPDFIIW
ncbi:uncharacterized protein BX663DRAFT_482161 [Cokeromyces recurvatus]|uniref:uncharacterized protein n=1 Tax=Cokeromyces recurvatus TaxID=90255 RepID=UPI00221F5F3D|nr:uncharacterized protein BX663DRAFT_482161 [Cokeromyces recurvatus]KAI7907910.1 hypothetical protein BX663DRAFT_482161 [Cokeromyces recurvatus]